MTTPSGPARTKAPVGAAVTLFAVAGLVLSACGSSTEEYCEALESSEQQFASFGAGEVGSFDDIASAFEELADLAPSDVEDDWETLRDGVAQIEAVYEQAGIGPEHLEEMSETGEVPEGVDPADLQELGENLERLETERFESASDTVGEHALEECDLEMGR